MGRVRWGKPRLRYIIYAILFMLTAHVGRKTMDAYQKTKARQAEIQMMIYEHDQRNFLRYQAIQNHMEELHILLLPKERYPLMIKPEPEPPAAIRATH